MIPTPVVAHGMVYCSSGRAGPTLAIRPGGRGDVTRSHLVWSSPRGSPFVPSPIVYGDYLYMVNDMASIVTCLEAMTGRTVWQGRLGVAQPGHPHFLSGADRRRHASRRRRSLRPHPPRRRRLFRAAKHECEGVIGRPRMADLPAVRLTLAGFVSVMRGHYSTVRMACRFLLRILLMLAGKWWLG